MARNFKDTFVMQCDYDTAQIGLTLGYSFSVPINVEDDMADIRVSFREAPYDRGHGLGDVLCTEQTSRERARKWILQTSTKFLVGYNLTVGVKEYRSGLDY